MRRRKSRATIKRRNRNREKQMYRLRRDVWWRRLQQMSRALSKFYNAYNYKGIGPWTMDMDFHSTDGNG
jgi:hypothetical protein